MCMKNIDALPTLQVAHLSYNPREKECACGRKPKASGQRQIAKPFRAHARSLRAKLPAVNRLCSEDGTLRPSLGERVERFRDEASRRVIILARIEGRKREHVKSPAGLIVRTIRCLSEDKRQLLISAHAG